MKRLVIILGFESSGSVFCGRVISYVLDKCSRFGEWKGYGWNGNIGDDLVIIHRSMPYGRKKKWMEELLEEISDMKNYSKEFIICTRDLNISKISRISRFGGDWSEYLRDDNAFLVKTDEKEICSPEMHWISGFYHGQLFPKLGDAQINQAREHMRFVLGNYDKALEKGRVLRELVFNKYTWQHAAERVATRIEEIYKEN